MLVHAPDITDAAVLLFVQQVSCHLLQALVEIHLDLVELVIVLVGIDEHDGERQRTEKIHLRRGECAKSDHAVHGLRLAEHQSDKGNVVLIRHHLHQARQRRKADVGPVRPDDAPISYADDELCLFRRSPALTGRNIAQRMGGLEDAHAHLRRDGHVVIPVQHP